MMRFARWLRGASEYLGYLAVAVGAALVFGWLARGKLPESPQSVIARSPADARLLETTLGLQPGSPAIIEFMDFQCPPCRASWPQVKGILNAHPGVTYRAVNFPLPMHPYAFGAAVAEEIAARGGQHDQVFNDLFTGVAQLDPAHLNAYLKSRNLPGIVGATTSLPFKRLVEADRALGKSLKVAGTPTLLVLSRDGSLSEVRGLGGIGALVN